MSMLKGKVRLRLYVCVYVIFLICVGIVFLKFNFTWLQRSIFTIAESKPIEVTVDEVSFQCDSVGRMRKYKIEIDFNGDKSTLTGYENYSKCSGKTGEKVKAHLNTYTNELGDSMSKIELD